MRNKVVLGVICSALTGGLSAVAEVTSGRNLEDRHDFSIGLTIGSVFDLEGEIRETTRPLEEIGGRTSGAPPEDYNWSELGFDDNFDSLGFYTEHRWRYVTLKFQFAYGNPEADSIADRDYYIGVDEVSFEGADYEYMKIPRGTPFSGDIDLYTIDLGVNITPVSFVSDEYFVEFTPWVHIGMFAFITDYSIDAGPATGLTQYENPPRNYVVGGEATGMNGIVIPKIGVGGELRFAISDNSDVIIEANVNYLKFDGDTGDFGISSRNEKAVEIDFITLSTRALVEVAMSEDLDFFIGVEFLTMDADATVEAKDKPNEEIEALREKFDKDVEFSMNRINLLMGLNF